MKKVVFGIFTLFLSLIGFTYGLDDGLYHNSDLGLISLVSGGNTVLTIQDKNVGATCTDIDSDCSIGCKFQYGNNYCFTGDMSDYPTDNSSLDLSSYAPSTYNSNGYIMYNMDAVNNNNIWGFNSDNLIDKKGPCDDGYHVFLKSDMGLLGSSSFYKYLAIFSFKASFLFPKDPFISSSYFGDSHWYDDVNSSTNSFIIGYNNASDLVSYLFSNASNNKYAIFPVRCVKNSVVDPDSSWVAFQFGYISESVGSNSYIVNYNSGQTQSFTTDQLITINGYSLYDGNLSFTPYFNISYVDEDNQTLTESYDKTNLILGGKFEKTYTGGENNFWVLTALGSSTIPDIIYTGLDFTGSSNISGNVFTNFVDNGFNVIGTNIPNFISYGFVLIILIILIRLILKFKGAGKGKI